MGTALSLWRHSCFPFLWNLLFDSLKKLRSYFDGVLTSSESSASSTEETSSSEPELTGKHQQIMEDDDELFEINLDAVGRKRDDSSPSSSPIAVRFSSNNQVLLANRLSDAAELSAAIPVIDQAPARARLPPEVMANWVLGGGCEKARSSSFRELTNNLRQLLKILAVPGRGVEDGGSSNRWGGDFGFRMEQLFSDKTRKTRWAAIP